MYKRILTIVCTVFFINYMRKKKLYRYLVSLIIGNLVPKIKAGNICQTQKNNIDTYTCGLGSLWLGKFVLIKDLNWIKKILAQPYPRKPRLSYRVFPRIIGFLGSGDFISSDTAEQVIYSKNRTSVYTVLMTRVVNCYNQIFKPSIEKHILDLPKLVNISELTHKIATSAITEVGFGIHDDSFDKEIFHKVQWMIQDVFKRPENIGFSILDYLPNKTNKKLNKNQKNLEELIRKTIRQKKNTNYEQIENPDLIQILLRN